MVKERWLKKKLFWLNCSFQTQFIFFSNHSLLCLSMDWKFNVLRIFWVLCILGSTLSLGHQGVGLPSLPTTTFGLYLMIFHPPLPRQPPSGMYVSCIFYQAQDEIGFSFWTLPLVIALKRTQRGSTCLG